jgi:fluoroquinolone resistance protein
VIVQLREVDFVECDLTNSLFERCDLLSAMFDGTTLEGSDLRTAQNFSIDPELNRVKKAKFSVDGLPGLLNKYNLIIE